MNQIKRSPHRGHYDQQTIYAILDSTFVCHVGFVYENNPMVIPMSYGRKENKLFLHGATTSRLMEFLAANNNVCITVTQVNGLVVARSMFDTSINYRSVVIHSNAQIIDDVEEKLQALHAISEHIIPGRWDEVRPIKDNELKATTLISIPIENASAKIRTGPPHDDARDLDLPIWAGLVSLEIKPAKIESDPALKFELDIPPSVMNFVNKEF